MSILTTSDNELRNLIFESPKVIVKFTKTDCPVCEKMGKVFLKLSLNPAYGEVKFLLMDAAENPVSSQEVKLTGTPFFAIYKDGLLQQCKLVSDEAELEEMLQDLL